MILGIESSCDDSSVALLNLEDLKLKFYRKISQESEHSEFGGVVPELAARLHTAALPALLDDVKPYFSQIKAIAVTNEPGLSVSLMSGVAMAKSLSIALRVPLIGVNHLIGHIYSLFIETNTVFPIGVLLVSGGHTLILDIDKDGKISVLASTSDDSFGESFDKVAKMLGLGYPGGVVVENLAKDGFDEFSFTIPLLHDKRLEYSFSGLKNQVRLVVERLQSAGELNAKKKANIAHSFQKTACLHIMDKLAKIYEQKKWRDFAIVGGASANIFLRNSVENLCKKYDSKLYLAPLKFCSDNAAMIARVGVEKYAKKDFLDYKSLQINPHLNFRESKILS